MTQRTRFTCAPASFSPQTFSALHYISGASFFMSILPTTFVLLIVLCFFLLQDFLSVSFFFSRSSHRFSFTVFVASTDFRAVASMKVIQMVCEVNGKKAATRQVFLFRKYLNDIKMIWKLYENLLVLVARHHDSFKRFSTDIIDVQ